MHKLFNRTFHLPTGDVFISSGGERLPDIIVSQFNRTVGNFRVGSPTFPNVVLRVISKLTVNYDPSWIFQPVLLFDAKSISFSFPFGRNFTWQDGQVPLNEPNCGYRKDSILCLVGNSGFSLYEMRNIHVILWCAAQYIYTLTESNRKVVIAATLTTLAVVILGFLIVAIRYWYSV